MRYIHRTETLSCLNNAKKKYYTWTNFKKCNPEGYKLIVDELTKIQDGLCVYCESKLGQEYHVEHFRCRAKFPQIDLDWNNLFLSCQNKQHCGIYKDGAKKNKEYDINLILKPDLEEDNPNKYFTYINNGDITCKSDLTEQQKIKAEKTIAVLNLNDKSLAGLRRKVFIALESMIDPEKMKSEKLKYQDIIDYVEKNPKEYGFPSLIESFLK